MGGSDEADVPQGKSASPVQRADNRMHTKYYGPGVKNRCRIDEKFMKPEPSIVPAPPGSVAWQPAGSDWERQPVSSITEHPQALQRVLERHGHTARPERPPVHEPIGTAQQSHCRGLGGEVDDRRITDGSLVVPVHQGRRYQAIIVERKMRRGHGAVLLQDQPMRYDRAGLLAHPACTARGMPASRGRGRSRSYQNIPLSASSGISWTLGS
jgi:hypothetical protein